MAYILNTNFSGFQQADGTAITSTSTDVDGGVAKAAGTSADNVLSSSNPSLKNPETSDVKVIAGVNVGQTKFDSAIPATGADGGGVYAGLFDIALGAHGRALGDVIRLTDTSGILNGYHRIVAIPDANSMVINSPYNAFAGTLTAALNASGTIANQDEGNYMIRRVVSRIAGFSNIQDLSTASSDFDRNKVHESQDFATWQIAKLIREGQWNPYDGVFDVNKFGPDYTNTDNPGADGETANDTNSRSVGGEFTYRTGAATATSDRYDPKNT